jgi:hypothetical protein
VLATIVSATMVAGGAGMSVHAANRAYCNAATHVDGNGWLDITPHFGNGPQQIQQLVAPAYDPSELIATNGTTLLASQDAGCHWATLVLAPGGNLVLPAPLNGVLQIPSSTTISSVSAPSSANIPARFLYVGLDDHPSLPSVVGQVVHPPDTPRIATYNGSSWVVADANNGLPRYGTITDVAGSPTSPNIAYAVIDPESSATGDGGLYVTTNGGQSWTQQASAVRSSDVRAMRVDPIVPTWVYALGPHGLTVSTDGGHSWAQGRAPAGDVASFDVADAGGAAVFVQGHTQAAYYDRSTNTGLSWSRVGFPTATADVALQPLLLAFAGSDSHRLWLQRVPGLAPVDITPANGGAEQLQFSAPGPFGSQLVGVRGGTVLQSILDLKLKQLSVRSLRPVQLVSAVGPKQFPSTLSPGRTRISLPAGAHQDVGYQLLLPRTPSPIDIMFLIDTTDSTDHTIVGLRKDLQTIVNRLATAGLNVQFGLADFRDYDPRIGNEGDGEIGDYPYRLDRRIGPVNAALAAALSRLKAQGGGDQPEADLTALYQSTTGVGQWFHRKLVIAPGLQAGYRPNALRLAVLATDAPFHKERHYLTPQWSTVVSSLLGAGVHQIGLAVQAVENDTGKAGGYPSFRDESRMALDTGTLAPRGGVDCNGDLSTDVVQGAPIVCRVPLQHSSRTLVGGVDPKSQVGTIDLTAAITTAAQSIPDYRFIGLKATGAPAGRVQVVAPRSKPRVDVKTDNVLHYTVRFSCPRLRVPRQYTVRISAGDGSRSLTSSTATLACAAVPPKTVVPPPLVPLAVAAAAPVPGNNPPPNVNPNPNPALNPNMGFASQEEEQRQLAFAGADTAVEDESVTEMEMSSLSRGDDSSGAGGWMLGGAALLLTAAAGYAARSRLAASWHRG